MFLKEINSGLNSGTICTFSLDFQKAFNVVCHEKLLENFCYYDSSGGVYAVIESYLTNRRQRIRVEDFSSDEVNVHSGVPRGSRLVTLFFILFVNDLSNCLMSKCFIYAEDLKVVLIAQ